MDAQPMLNGEVLRRDGIVGWHHDGHLWSSVCSLALEACLIRAFIYLHIMALHAEREHFGFGLGVGTFVLPFISFVASPAAAVLVGWQLHQDQSRSLVEYNLIYRF